MYLAVWDEFGHFPCFIDFLKVHKQYVFNKEIQQYSCFYEICENAFLLANRD